MGALGSWCVCGGHTPPRAHKVPPPTPQKLKVVSRGRAQGWGVGVGCTPHPPAHSSVPPAPDQKLEEQDRRALSIKEQLQREHRFLKRRLEQLSAQSLERVRTDSTGSAVSTDDSEQGGPRGGGLACWQPRGGAALARGVAPGTG